MICGFQYKISNLQTTILARIYVMFYPVNFNPAIFTLEHLLKVIHHCLTHIPQNIPLPSVSKRSRAQRTIYASHSSTLSAKLKTEYQHNKLTQLSSAKSIARLPRARITHYLGQLWSYTLWIKHSDRYSWRTRVKSPMQRQLRFMSVNWLAVKLSASKGPCYM